MGRICFEDFQDYASSREVIVLSKNNTSSFPNAHSANSLKEALELAKKMKRRYGFAEAVKSMKKRFQLPTDSI